MGRLRYLADVVTLELDIERCTGCGLCAEVCPQAVFAVEGRKARILDRDACMECGACAMNCPVEAIRVRSGVGCAAGILTGAIRCTDPCCGSSDDCGGSCCG